MVVMMMVMVMMMMMRKRMRMPFANVCTFNMDTSEPQMRSPCPIALALNSKPGSTRYTANVAPVATTWGTFCQSRKRDGP